MFKSLQRKSTGEKILYCSVSAIFMVVALSYIYILVWTVISSLKTHTEIVMNPFSLPAKWQFQNYLELPELFNVNGHTFFSMLFNSVWFSVVGSIIMQFVSVTFAYACTTYSFPGSKWIYPIILVMLTLPIYGTGGAVYKIYYYLGLVDTYAHVLASASGFNTFFLYYTAYVRNLSLTYVEAAAMDGADDFQIYFMVMLPQIKPLFFANFVVCWLGSWNNYESAMIYLPNLPTLPVGIYQFNVEMIYRARLDVLFAACFIVTIPALIIFGLFNKTLTESVSIGGIKG